RVIETANMPGVKGGNVLTYICSLDHHVEQRLGERWPRNERGKQLPAFGWMELSVSLHQLYADGGIAERRQATCRDGIQEAHVEQLFAKLSQVRWAVVDEG